ncbi:MAG: hypothetical protein K0M49_12215 [Arenimonas sp.]|nr:hypothetical protein [Rhizobium sp.]MBW8446384.1 hypothetical protein [Arenimonas sp.]
MDDGQDHWLGLLGLGPRSDSRRGPGSGPAADADAAALERKSAEGLSPLDRLAALLDDLTTEMRQQFELFRKLRVTAEKLIDGADEAAAKAARADAKAATDAIALIVRTLEKIDSLQRQLARDREEAALASGEGEDEEAIRQELLRIIENQAEARARARFAAWQCQAVPGGAAAGQPEPEATPGARSG